MSLSYKIILSGLLLFLLSHGLVGSAKGLELDENANTGKKTNDTDAFAAQEYEEIGPCSVTCGIGVREVLLTKGCPGEEKKCVIRVEECRGPVRCGWGKPVYISDDVVELQCIFTNPSKKYDFVWKLIATDQEPIILKEDQPTIHVEKDDQPVAYQCDTLLEGDVVASIKYSVYTNTEALTRSGNPGLGIKSQIVLMAVAGCAVMVVISIICGIVFFCLRRRSKQHAKKKVPPPRPPLPSQYDRRKGGKKHMRKQEANLVTSVPQHTNPPPRPPPPSPSRPSSPRKKPPRPRGPPPPRPCTSPHAQALRPKTVPHPCGAPPPCPYESTPRLNTLPHGMPSPRKTSHPNVLHSAEELLCKDKYNNSHMEDLTLDEYISALDNSKYLK